MSIYRTKFELCEEWEVDSNDNVIACHKKHLPHFDIIAKEMTTSFNNMHIEQYIDESVRNKIESIRMTAKEMPDGTPMGYITFKSKPGARLTQKTKEILDDEICAQFSDGWGEGFFGMINIMQAPDGARFFAE